MRVLVTGATGFIGYHVARALLEHGHEVRLLVRRSPPSDLVHRGAEVWFADLRRPQEVQGCLRGVEAVVHVAGQIRGWGFRDFYWGNTVTTRTLLLEAQRHHLLRFVYFSSLAAQGPKGGTGPVSHYGRSKRLAESWVRRGSSDFNWVILRPGVVYGPRDRALLPYVRWLQRRRWLGVPVLPRQLGFVYVEDLVSLTLWALDAPQADRRVLCVMHPSPLSLADLLRELARRLGVPLRGVPVPPQVLRALMPWTTALYPLMPRPPLLNPDKLREALQRDWVCEHPWEVWRLSGKTPTPLEVGLDRTLRDYRERGWL